MKVVWSPHAMRMLNDILDFLEPLNPHAARRIGREMFRTAAGLADLPHRHRDRGHGIRVMPVLGTPYLIHYRVEAERGTVRILLVRHGHQQAED